MSRVSPEIYLRVKHTDIYIPHIYSIHIPHIYGLFGYAVHSSGIWFCGTYLYNLITILMRHAVLFMI